MRGTGHDRVLDDHPPGELDAVSGTGVAPSYPELLQEAFALGRQDGAFAAAFEPVGPAESTGRCCQGRTPAQFARLIWGERTDRPPAGLELNAPHWYAAGFAEGLAACGGHPHGREHLPRPRPAVARRGRSPR